MRVGDELDVDWTLAGDYSTEIHLRHQRNLIIEDMLKSNRTVAYRSSGWSLYPRVHCGDLCIYHPVSSGRDIEPGNIVFCRVQPSGYHYAHLVKRIVETGGVETFWISNLAGRENGYCLEEHVFGKLMQVLK